MKIKAIIFDFDGVLVESMDIKAQAFAYLFRDYPDQIDPIIKLHMRHGGMPRFEKFERIYRDILHLPLSKEQSKRLGEEFSRYAYREVLKCPYVPGAKEFLEANHKIFKLFVVSGTPDAEVKLIIKERGMGKYFVDVLGSPTKKASHIIDIMNKYKLRPDEVVFVGDSIDDYEGAKEAKIIFIARLVEDGPFSNDQNILKIGDLFDLERVIYNET